MGFSLFNMNGKRLLIAGTGPERTHSYINDAYAMFTEPSWRFFSCQPLRK